MDEWGDPLNAFVGETEWARGYLRCAESSRDDHEVPVAPRIRWGVVAENIRLLMCRELVHRHGRGEEGEENLVRVRM